MNEIATLNENQQTSLVKAVEECHLAASMKNDMMKSLKLAHGQAQLSKILRQPEVAQMIMGFQNSAIGFLTDRKPHGYEEGIVLQCTQEALTAGAYLHGNEWNIIAGRCYFAQSFFVRMVREFCTKNLIKRQFQYDCKYVEPSGKQKKFKVTVRISWTFPAKKEESQIECYNLIGVSEDQVLGKAKKRAHQWLYNELTDNNYIAVPDDEVIIDMPIEPEPPAPPKASKKTVIEAIQSSENLEDLEAKYKRACDNHGYSGDNEVHAVYTEMKESFQ